MSTTKGTLTVLLLAIMILTTRQSALGQSEVSTPESFITVDKTTHGTKVFGTLTISYEVVPESSCLLGVEAKALFMRLRKGKDLFPFSGDLSGEHICSTDNPSVQQTAIEEFVKEKGILELFLGTSSAPFALRSVDEFVQGGNGFDEPLFVSMDFVIAVQEK